MSPPEHAATGAAASPDEPYFREWDARAAGQRRSLPRARELLARAGLAGYRPRVLTVVGSKGKGTTAVYASAWLAAAGRRVVTVTSPSLRHSTERIRVDGTAVDARTLARLGRWLMSLAPPAGDGEGYLSPGGLFTLAALAHASELGIDHLVLEAGRGGASDEVSLVPPEVVAVTPIFAEHLEQLGGTIESVVADKCGVIQPSTRAVVAAPQLPEVRKLIAEAVAVRTGGRLRVKEVPPAPGQPAGLAAGLAGQPAGLPELPERFLPPGLGRANALTGAAAARLLAGAPPAADLAAVLASLRLPGRLSLHRLPGTGTTLLVDAAVDRAGYAAALRYGAGRLGTVDHVLLSVPDDKDLDGAVAQFGDGTGGGGTGGGAPVTFVTVPASHLRYARPTPPAWRRVDLSQVDDRFVAGLGERVLAVGTVSFVGHLLGVADAATATAFHPARPRH